jgi:hypothetical protein
LIQFGRYLVGIFLLFLAANAAAFPVEIPGNINVFDAPKEVSLVIRNDSGTEKHFTVDFVAPARIELSEAEGTIPAGGFKKIYVTVFPREDLLEQTYETSLIVELGDEKIVKKVNIIFKPSFFQEQDSAQEPTPVDFSTLTGFFSFFSIPAMNFGQYFSWETALNVFLVIVAAILLIAFIARFTRRISEAKQ